MCCYVLAATAWFTGQAYYAYYLGRLFNERCTDLNEEEQRIYESHFKETLSVLDFQRFVRRGTFMTSESRSAVVSRDDVAPPLILVIDGLAEVEMDVGVTLPARPGLFGEVAFLSDRPAASATVFLLPGCRFVRWESHELALFLEGYPAIRSAIENKANRDLANKLVDTRADLVCRQRSTEYREAVLGVALRRLLAAGADGAASSGCGDLVVDLSELREALGVDDDLHAQTMRDLGLLSGGDDNCSRGEVLCSDASLQEAAALVAARIGNGRSRSHGAAAAAAAAPAAVEPSLPARPHSK